MAYSVDISNRFGSGLYSTIYVHDAQQNLREWYCPENSVNVPTLQNGGSDVAPGKTPLCNGTELTTKELSAAVVKGDFVTVEIRAGPNHESLPIFSHTYEAKDKTSLYIKLDYMSLYKDPIFVFLMVFLLFWLFVAIYRVARRSSTN